MWVVLPVFNRKENLEGFIRSVKEQTFPNIAIVICDDASSDGSAEYLSENHPDVVLLEGTGDLWWTGGINRCIDYVLNHCDGEDYVLTINDDVTLNPGYLQQKVEQAFDNPDCIIGSVCVYKDDTNKIETSGLALTSNGFTVRPLVPHGEKLSKLSRQGLVEATHLPGKGVLIPVSIYQRIGVYDQEHFPHYHADSEFTLRAHKAGIKVYVDFSSRVFSSVNRSNAGVASTGLSWKKILHSFTSPYGLNSVQTYWNLACIHYQQKKFRYLISSYGRIVLGILARKLRLRRLYNELSR